MKKIIFVFTFFSICLITFFASGCVWKKDYKDVAEYYDKVSPNWKLYKDLVITGKKTTLDDIVVPINYKQSGGKWVSDKALYDGTNIYFTENISDNYVVKINDNGLQYREIADHPLRRFINWDEYINGAVFKENTTKNGMQCRMIEVYVEGKQELCISDKYGIAIYYAGKDNMGSFKYEITSIEERKIPDETFKFPPNVKVKTLDEYFKD